MSLIGDVALSTSSDDKALTLLRREHVGFVFQAFNLLPTLTARENVLLPLTLAGRKPDPGWLEATRRVTGTSATGWATGPPSCPAGSSSGWRWRGRWSPGPTLLFADEPTGDLDSQVGG